MTTTEAIKILREMNKWRRGEHPYDGETPETHRGMPYSPQEFGEAIDEVVERIEEYAPELAYNCHESENGECCGACDWEDSEDSRGNAICLNHNMPVYCGMVCDKFKKRINGDK